MFEYNGSNVANKRIKLSRIYTKLTLRKQPCRNSHAHNSCSCSGRYTSLPEATPLFWAVQPKRFNFLFIVVDYREFQSTNYTVKSIGQNIDIHQRLYRICRRLRCLILTFHVLLVTLRMDCSNPSSPERKIEQIANYFLIEHTTIANSLKT